MVHLLPLPGAPGWAGSMPAVVERALTDAEALVEGGVDGVLVENYGDVPFRGGPVEPATVAAMARVVSAVVDRSGLPTGVNVLRNDALAALSVAAVSGAAFIRVNVHSGALLTDQGWIEGRAAETMRERERLGAAVAVFADVAVKHAVIPVDLDIGQAASDAWERGLADGLIVTGTSTGGEVDAGRVHDVRAAVPGAWIWVGSGLTPANAARLAPLGDGLIAGSSLQHGGRAGAGVDVGRVRELVAAIRALD
jgi:membrane complex biogenesis BtpA family protein